MNNTAPSSERLPAAQKPLGLLAVFSLAGGAMISSGLFVLPGLAFELAGPAMILAYALASLLVVPALFAQGELGTAMPKSGGSYFFIERSLGPLLGTIAGLTGWLSIVLKSAFALFGMGVLATLVLPTPGPWTIRVTALVGLGVFTGLNLLGAKESARFQSLLMVALLGVIGLVFVGGVPALEGHRLLPFVPHGWHAVLAVAGMVFVSYSGLNTVVAVAEEVHNPRRNLPLGMFLAYGVVSLCYIALAFVVVGVLEGDRLAGSTTPLSLAAQATLGTVGAVTVGIGALLAFSTTANGGLLAAARLPLAMGRDGLMPAFFARVGNRRKTPLPAIVLSTLAMGAAVLFLDLESLVKVASTVNLLLFALLNLAVVVMRASKVESYRPTFRSPLYPWMQLAAMAIYVFFIVEMGLLPVAITGAFAVVATAYYLGYVHRRIDRQSALRILITRLVDRNLDRSHLDEELVRICLERDEVQLDRFDRLVQTCPVLDFQESVDVKELFRRVATVLHKHDSLTAERCYELFVERERDSSTVISPGVAIPHIIVPGEQIFELVLVRCRPGIDFGELHAPVVTAFVLIGSADQRNIHLRVLMTIAQVVQTPGFLKRWEAAATEDHLRDVVLLSERHRHHSRRGRPPDAAADVPSPR